MLQIIVKKLFKKSPQEACDIFRKAHPDLEISMMSIYGDDMYMIIVDQGDDVLNLYNTIPIYFVHMYTGFVTSTSPMADLEGFLDSVRNHSVKLS